MNQVLNALKNRNLSLYVIGVFLSKIGDKIYLLAMPWLIYELTGSAFGMGLMFLVETIPFIFISPIAGLLADKFSRRNILIISALLQSIAIASIIGLNTLNVLEVWMIYVLGFLVTSAGATFLVLHDTIIPQLFDKDKLVSVNSIFQFMETSTLLIGTAVAGTLIAAIGIFPVLGLVSISYGAIVLTVIFLRFTTNENFNPISGGSFKQFLDGLMFVKNHKIIGPLVLITLLANIANAAMMALLVFFARDQLGLNPQQVSWIYGIGAIAQIISIIVVSRFAAVRFPIRIMLICQFISSIGIIWIGSSVSWIFVAIGLALQNGPTIMYNVLNRSLRQRIVPTNMLGRVNGVILMLSQSAFPLSGFLGGVFAEIFNVRYVLISVGIFSFIIITLFWLSSIRKFKISDIEDSESISNNYM